jgi:hypothetical protein|tara:strand:- start:2078 stop:3217 length:1140 start_codon:yes stop_codon:yes gene_type:complete
MQILTSFKKTITINFLLIGSLAIAAEPIGEIVEQKGYAGLQRDGSETILSASELPDVLMYDTAQTVNGRMKIQFKGTEELDLTEHTKVWIDEVYYDPDPSKSKMAIRMAQGTARFASGFGGKIKKANINITTPTAQITVNGTDFTTSIDEIGRSLVILLPDKWGAPSGSILVSNAGGEVLLDEAYQATMVSTYDSSPTKPVVVNGITPSLIDNLFIVSPPDEVNEQVAEEQRSNENDSNNVLDVDFLEFNDLEENYFEDDELEYTELDRDLLDVDFLQDLLDVVLDIDRKVGIDREVSNAFGVVRIDGTLPGFDKDTQYNTIVDKGLGQIWFYREVNGIISIRLPIYAQANIRTVTDEKESLIRVGDGSSLNITITQTN